MHTTPTVSVRTNRVLHIACVVAGLVLCLCVRAARSEEEKSDTTAKVAEHVKALNGGGLDARRKAVYALWQLEKDAQPAIPALAKALRDPDEYVRTTADKALQRFSFDQAGAALNAGVTELLAGAADSRAPVRIASLRTLWRLGPLIQPIPDALLPTLTKALTDNDPLVRATAIGIAQNLGPRAKSMMPALKQRVADEDAEVRLWAVRALGSLDPANAVEALLGVVEDEDERVRADALLALSAVGGGLPGLGVGAPAAVVKAIRKALGDTVPAVRSAAVNALWGTETRASAPDLIALLREDPDVGVRATAARALGGLGSPEALEPLTASMQHEDVNLRAACAMALGQLGPESAKALPMIIGAIGSADAPVRSSALLGLGQLGHVGEPALEHVLARLGDEDPWVRTMASQALVQMVRADVRHEAIVPAVAKMLAGPNAPQGSYAVQALIVLCADAAPALDVLLERLGDAKSPSDKRVYVDALGAIGPPAKKAAPHLRRALTEPDGDAYLQNAILVALGRIRAKDEDLALALDTLGGALEDERGRRNAIWSLGRLGPAAAPVAARIEHWMLAGDEPDLTAAGALLRIRGEAASKARAILFDAMKDQGSQAALRFFAEAGSSQAVAAPQVLSRLDSAIAFERVDAAKVLGLLGVKSEAVIAKLNAALKDPAAAVRTAASLALHRLGE